MPIVFYPREGDLATSTLQEKLEALQEAAEAYKAVVLDPSKQLVSDSSNKKRTTPREMTASFNWEEIAGVLQTIRAMPEASQTSKDKKADALTKLAEIYEVLRAAKMSKLEAVRLALMSEAKQLRSGGTATARVA